jgi:hypothetical protein
MKIYILIGLVIIFGGLSYYYFMRQPKANNNSDVKLPYSIVVSEEQEQDFLKKISEYITKNKIDVSPGTPNGYKISSIEMVNYQGKPRYAIHLDCCYLGDIAYIDPHTYQVMGFVTGAK